MAVPTSSSPSTFEIRIRIESAHLDEQGHVNNVVYLRWAQDVATAHWEVLAPAEDQASVGWVVLRHEIDYLAAGLLGEELVVRTWVGTIEGLSFERHTEVLRADEKLLARARTLWCPINPRTGRPKRVRRELRELFLRLGSERRSESTLDLSNRSGPLRVFGTYETASGPSAKLPSFRNFS